MDMQIVILLVVVVHSVVSASSQARHWVTLIRYSSNPSQWCEICQLNLLLVSVALCAMHILNCQNVPCWALCVCTQCVPKYYSQYSTMQRGGQFRFRQDNYGETVSSLVIPGRHCKELMKWIPNHRSIILLSNVSRMYL